MNDTVPLRLKTTAETGVALLGDLWLDVCLVCRQVDIQAVTRFLPGMPRVLRVLVSLNEQVRMDQLKRTCCLNVIPQLFPIASLKKVALLAGGHYLVSDGIRVCVRTSGGTIARPIWTAMWCSSSCQADSRSAPAFEARDWS